MKSSSKKKDPEVLVIGNEKVARGERKIINLEYAALYDYTKLNIPVEVIRGKKPGPVLFVSAAIHGDELNGIEIVRRLAKKKIFSKLKGTLILIPIVNIFGFNNKSRYLPDRRDLNRSFPGKKTGSLAAMVASIFMKEIVSHCTHGIDLHTGAIHRTNLPQIRAWLDNEETRTIAEGFGVPVVINSKLRDGSLREAARKKKVSMLLFEGGQALRFEEDVIKTGLRGCISVMKKIKMLDEKPATPKVKKKQKIYIAKSSFWERATHSGAFVSKKKIGDEVKVGDILATISDPLGRNSYKITAQEEGILIGATLLPLVNKGDAMFHIATFKNLNRVSKAIEDWN